MEELRIFISQFLQPNEEEFKIFFSYIKQENFPKGKKIIRYGSVCERMYFVKKGLLKYVMEDKNHKEKTNHIAANNDLVADFFSFYSGYPSIATVETITDCELLVIEKKDLESLYNEYKTWERFGRLVAQSALLEQIMEKIDIQTKSPEQRYTELIAKKPFLLQEVNLGIIAEYLGIRQETLSRIRAKI